MRASPSRIAATCVVGLLIAACASTSSPAPTTTATPTGLPTPSTPSTPPDQGRRGMSADHAAVLGLSDKGGVQRIYLRDPDHTTIYDFSLWPKHPDETG